MVEGIDFETQEAAFTSVGSEHRLEILETLLEAANAGERPLSFSTLRDRVSVEDSGQLGYHLRKLDGRFVDRTDDGYVLRSPGRNVVQAAAAGSFGDTEPRTIDVPGVCPNCSDELEASYEDGWLTIKCTGCGHPLTVWSYPPRAAIERDDADLSYAFDSRVRHRIAQVIDGVCPDCGGIIEFEKTTTAFSDRWLFERLPLFECRGCYAQFCPTFGMIVLDTPTVHAFYREQGRDIQQLPFWTIEPCVSDNSTAIQNNPLEVTIRFATGNATLAVHLAEDLSISDFETISEKG